MPVLAGAELGHYALVEKIGEGGMGVVWRARDLKLDREVALKVLPEARISDPDWLARLEQEARAAAALSHPNAVAVHAIEEAEGVRFLVFELVHGRSLAELIPPTGLPLERIVGLGAGIAGALAAAHRRGLTHRDLKPRNVMVDESGAARVLDFGLAAFLPPAAPEASPDSPTRPYPPLPGGGTLCYMAPEQLRGAPPDPSADVWSLGVLLFEMACGKPPFRGATPADLVSAVLLAEPEPLARSRPDLPPELAAVVSTCLRKDPARRALSADDVRQALLRLPASEARERKVAVLPFVDMSREHDQGWLCDGLAEEILLTLRGVPGLRVVSRAAAFSARAAAGPTPDLGELGRRLGASVLLDGSVRQADGKVRVAVELIDVDDGAQLWAFRHEGGLGDVFALQDQIARQVAAALEVQFGHAASAPAGTTQLRAWELYHRARRLYYRYSRRAVEEARALFEHALGEDPAFARAWAGLADCGFFLYLYVHRDPEALHLAREASRRALELQPALAEAHASRGMGLSLDGRHVEAERAFEEAVRLDPDLFEARYFRARDAFAQGRLTDAAREWEAAARARPEDFQSPLLVAQVYDALAQPEAADAARRRGVALAEAQAAREPDDTRALYMAANGLVALGERERGLALSERALALEPDDPMLLYNVGCILALAAEPERAIDCLVRAVAGGLRQRGWLEHDSNLDSLRANPRFQALLESIPAEA